MEALLRQSKGVCPFLKKTSPATLRSLSTSTHQSPGGGAITNLQFIARRCPVMNKALAVQSARIGSQRSYGKLATGTGVVKSLLEKKLHTSAEKKASVDTDLFRPAQPGKSPLNSELVNIHDDTNTSSSTTKKGPGKCQETRYLCWSKAKCPSYAPLQL